MYYKCACLFKAGANIINDNENDDFDDDHDDDDIVWGMSTLKKPVSVQKQNSSDFARYRGET